MQKLKKAWNDFTVTPRQMKAIQGWSVVFWIVMTPISWYFGWLAIITYVSLISIWALVVTHFAGWAAARTEVRQEEMEKNNKG